ncbi:hypothetical protein [Georhizobium sp. MAB10]|uniref:hypothetical protein n=1 Tax=Georhizobium sp. MAB10 TaxID=3028319 RepID=UPI003855F707
MGTIGQNAIHVSGASRETELTVEFALEQLNLIFDPEPFAARISIDDFYWTIDGNIAIESAFWEHTPTEFLETLATGRRLTVAMDGFRPISFSLGGTGKAVEAFDLCRSP